MTDAAALSLPLEPVAAAQVREGSPATGYVELTDEIGVWEHTPGTSTDVEADEVFVVLSGAATLSFDVPELPDRAAPGLGRTARGRDAHGVDRARDAPQGLPRRLTGAPARSLVARVRPLARRAIETGSRARSGRARMQVSAA